MTLQKRLILSFIAIFLICFVPLTFFSLKIISECINLWYQPEIEQTLEQAIFKSKDLANQKGIKEALKSYRQLKALKGPMKREIIGLSIFLGLIAFLLSGTVSWLLIIWLTKPLKILTQATREVSRGNLEIELKPQGSLEMRELMESFNQMAENLKQSRQELIKTQRIAAWKEVAQYLAHEIKNPLTPIKLGVERLTTKYSENQTDFSDTLTKCTKTILKELDNLEELVECFGKFAKLPKPKFAPEDINKLIDEILSLYIGSPKKVRITSIYDEKIPLISLDAAQIKQVLKNLIENALAAVDENGRIEIKTKFDKANNQIFISVSDNGRGMTKEELERLFFPHFTTKKKGLGLGLAVVDKIISEHGGKIVVESKLGKGSEFKISLPLKKK
jgi:nitrogen fixation/metabolism regulation signal transduction histidine kinase